MPVLEMLETTPDSTVEKFLTEVTATAADLRPDCFDNRPTWDNWGKR